MRFLLDECVTIHAPPLLVAYSTTPQTIRYEITTVAKEFGSGALDEVWMPGAAAWNPKPVVLSGDVRRCTGKAKREAIKAHGMVWFALAKGWTNTPWGEYSWKIVKVWPTIVEIASKARGVKLYMISIRSLDVEEILL